VKQYHCRQRDMDDKAVERGRRILRKTAGLSQTIPSTKQRINNPMFTMACLASARGYGRIRCVPDDDQPLLLCGHCERRLCGDREADRCLAARSFRYGAPRALCIIFRCIWTESAFCPFNQTVEGHGLVFAADNPKSALRRLSVRRVKHFVPPSLADRSFRRDQMPLAVELRRFS
jgi:hypothetical protein